MAGRGPLAVLRGCYAETLALEAFVQREQVAAGVGAGAGPELVRPADPAIYRAFAERLVVAVPWGARALPRPLCFRQVSPGAGGPRHGTGGEGAACSLLPAVAAPGPLRPRPPWAWERRRPRRRHPRAHRAPASLHTSCSPPRIPPLPLHTRTCSQCPPYTCTRIVPPTHARPFPLHPPLFLLRTPPDCSPHTHSLFPPSHTQIVSPSTHEHTAVGQGGVPVPGGKAFRLGEGSWHSPLFSPPKRRCCPEVGAWLEDVLSKDPGFL